MDQPPYGRVIAGRYELGEIIGTGGMGEVRAGRDLELDRPVAIKFLRPQMDPQIEVKIRFASEAEAASRLSHPNIVAVFDAGEDEGVPFIVMELLSGRTLAHKLAGGPLDPGEVQRFGLEILDALEASHAQGILHRDLKPGNVMLTQHGTAKVADFGIAKITEGMDITGTGMMLGTPAYLAPERVAGKPATPASDIYSAGVVLYELLTAKRPFEADTPLGLVRAMQEEEPQPLTEARPNIDPALAAIVERAIAKDPAQRYSSAREMAQALEDWVPVLPMDHTQPLQAEATRKFKIGKKGPSKTQRRFASAVLVILAIGWPLFVINRLDRPPSSDVDQTPSVEPPPPASIITPELEGALGRLEGAIAEAGALPLQPGVQAIRSAAQSGDRAAASEQLALLKARTGELGQQGALVGPAGEEVLAALGEVEAQISPPPPPEPPPPAPPPP